MTSSKKINRVSNQNFNTTFLGGKYQSSQNKAIQIHDIAVTSPFFKVPSGLHKPSYNYFVIILKGSALQFIEGNKFQLKENDILFVKEGTITSIDFISKDIEGFVLTIETESLAKILSRKDFITINTITSVTNLSYLIINWIINILLLIKEELNIEYPNMNICISLVEAFIHKLLEEISKQTNDTFKLSRSAALLFEFKELVYKNFHIEKSISFYSNKLNTSSNYLNRCVKERTGITVKEWINKITIQNAKLLLQTTNKDISEIAFEFNFDDPSYFGRLFKKVVGISPREYREQVMHDLSDYQSVKS